MKIGQFQEYKNYIGSIEYDASINLYSGSLLNSYDIVMYEANDFVELEKNYRDAVDDYINLRNLLNTVKLGEFAEYKGYIGTIEYEPVTKMYYGSIPDIPSLPKYKADNVIDLEREYQMVLDSFIEGNSVSRSSFDLSDDILSDMSIKRFLSKWSYAIYIYVIAALRRYYMRDDNNLQKAYVEDFFVDVHKKMCLIIHMFDDLVYPKLHNVEYLFSDIYGEHSDKLYALKCFNVLYENIDVWNESKMWDNCKYDVRLFNILSNA